VSAVTPRPAPDQRGTPVNSRTHHREHAPERADDAATSSGNCVIDSEELAPIDPADVMPVVFIPWDAPGEYRPSDCHVCDDLCGDDDPPEEHVVLSVDDSRADDGLG
jgi:hypothetical protein